MTAKYQNLDLDTQPDIYETPDPASQPAAFAAHHPETGAYSEYDDDENDDEGVVRTRVNVEAAADKFAEWSTGAKKSQRRSVRRGKEHVSEETPTQKLRRLLDEAADLAREVESQPKEEEEKENKSMADGRPKVKRATRTQLLSHITSLQVTLGHLSDKIVTKDGRELMVSGGENGVGSLVRQAEVGKNLVNQLRNLKNLSISEEMSTVTASQSQNTNPETDPYVTYELFYTPSSMQQMSLASIASLESRLTTLERLIGLPSLQTTSATTGSNILQETSTLISSLQKLDRSLSLLTQPRQLEMVALRVKAVVADMERLMELRKRQQLENTVMFGKMGSEALAIGSGTPGGSGIGGDRSATSQLQDIHLSQSLTESARKISHIYDTLQKLDPVASLLPNIITRLHALKSLHTEAATFSDTLQMLAEEQERVGTGFNNIDESIKRVERSLEENEKRVEKNVERLVERAESVKERVEELMKRLEGHR
ncbi:hypothetical protein HDU85_002435 [Gaertneriomyces sp. JEL0708]|nr:hypothetical protein HDU85_002435 [Gaertneriomyces sp. JEL0708]